MWIYREQEILSYHSWNTTGRNYIANPDEYDIRRFRKTYQKRFPRWKNYCKVNFIRYADDFIITAASREIIEKEIIPLVTEFLKERGLSLSPEKTKITQITEGFDFLSQNSRKYRNGKLFQMPSQNAVKEIKHKLRTEVFHNMGAKPHDLIHSLNSCNR